MESGYRNGIYHRKICHADMEGGKRESTERIEHCKIKKASDHLEKKENSVILEYWKSTQLNKQKWKKK